MKTTDDDKKDLEKIMDEEEISEKLATSLLCTKKGGFEYLKKQQVYCGVEYDCVYKADKSRCMNLKKQNLWMYQNE